MSICKVQYFYDAVLLKHFKLSSSVKCFKLQHGLYGFFEVLKDTSAALMV